MTLVGDDCYFFLNNGCVRGNMCSFRHQPGAKNNDVCPDWIKGTCVKPTCVLRHHMIDVNRAKVPCYWEQQPNGCLKANCQFLHSKSTIAAIPTAAPVHIVVPKTTPVNEQDRILPAVAAINSAASPVIQNGVVPNPQISNMQVTNPISNQLRPIVNSVVPGQANLVMQSLRPQGLVIHSDPSRKPVLGPPPKNNIFPKNEHFTQQVELFKKMLASKSISGGGDYKENKHVKDDDEIIDDEFDEAEERSRRNRERQRQARKKKTKEVQPKNRKHKKSKDGWSKGDQEILYGDYKDVPLDSKRKKRNPEKSPSSESDINVKPYEDILREKALRKLLERRKQKFNADFEDIVSEKKQSKSKKGISEKTKENRDIKPKTKAKEKVMETVINESISDDIECFREEDAVEVEVDTSPIRDIMKSKKQQNKQTVEKVKNDEVIKKNSRVNQESVETEQNFEKGHEVIPIEELISVDDDDELAQELKQSSEIVSNNDAKKRKGYKKVISSVVVPKSKTEKQNASKKVTTFKKDDISKKDKKDKNYQKIVTVKNETIKEKSPEVAVSPVKNLGNKLSEVKVKSFEEIMEEKRRRKATSNTGNNTTEDGKDTLKKPADKLKEATAKSKSDLLKKNKPPENLVTSSTVNVIVPPTTLNGTAKAPPQINRNRLRRLGSNGENDEEKQKRKSLQLYKPPSKPDEAQEIKEVKTVVNTGPRKIIRIQKSVLYPSEKIALEEKEKTLATDQVDGPSKTGGVKSFEEIMREKRLRKQKEENSQLTGNRAHRFMKSKTMASTKINQVPPTSSNTVQTTTAVPKSSNEKTLKSRPTARNFKKKLSSESSKEEELLHNSMSTTAVVEQKPLASIVSSSNERTELLRDVEEPPIRSPRHSLSDEQVSISNIFKEGHKKGSDSGTPPSSMEDIREALSESKRKREEDLLSDDDFEKELEGLSDNESDIDDDINEDDLMMELEEMIGS